MNDPGASVVLTLALVFAGGAGCRSWSPASSIADESLPEVQEVAAPARGDVFAVLAGSDLRLIALDGTPRSELRHQADAPTRLAVAPDGGVLALGEYGKPLRVIEVRGDQLVPVGVALPPPGDPSTGDVQILHFAWSPDGARLVAALGNGAIVAWRRDALAAPPAPLTAAQAGFRTFALDPTRPVIAVAIEDRVELRELVGGRILAVLPGVQSTRLEFSPGGALATVGSDTMLRDPAGVVTTLEGGGCLDVAWWGDALACVRSAGTVDVCVDATSCRPVSLEPGPREATGVVATAQGLLVSGRSATFLLFPGDGAPRPLLADGVVDRGSPPPREARR